MAGKPFSRYKVRVSSIAPAKPLHNNLCETFKGPVTIQMYQPQVLDDVKPVGNSASQVSFMPNNKAGKKQQQLTDRRGSIERTLLDVSPDVMGEQPNETIKVPREVVIHQVERQKSLAAASSKIQILGSPSAASTHGTRWFSQGIFEKVH